MNRSMRTTTGLMLAAMLAACGPSQPSGETEPGQTAETLPETQPSAPEASEPAPAAPAPAAEMPQTAGMVVYACDDGSSLTVTYDENGALVKLPTGSTMLPRAETVSKGAEAYLGEELSLHRDGNLVQLQVTGKTRICTNSATG